MIELSRNAVALIALVCGAWLCLGMAMTIRAARRGREAAAGREGALRAEALLGSGPAMPLLVLADGRIEGGHRLSAALGLSGEPQDIAALSAEDAGLAAEDAALLSERVAMAAASGGSFSMAVRAAGSARVHRVHASPAPHPYPPSSVILWFIDATESEEQMAALRGEVGSLATAIEALSALIEAAPFPMWHRGPDLRLAMVNSAYVAAVEAEDAMTVVEAGIELVDESEERSPLSQAAAVRDTGDAIARTDPRCSQAA